MNGWATKPRLDVLQSRNVPASTLKVSLLAGHQSLHLRRVNSFLKKRFCLWLNFTKFWWPSTLKVSMLSGHQSLHLRGVNLFSKKRFCLWLNLTKFWWPYVKLSFINNLLVYFFFDSCLIFWDNPQIVFFFHQVQNNRSDRSLILESKQREFCNF